VEVVVAPGPFGAVGPVGAARAIAEGWARGAPHDRLVLRPLADGGPGFLEVVRAACGGDLVPVQLPAAPGTPGAPTGPGAVLRVGTTAYVESVPAATSYPTGVLVAAAAALGVREVVVGIGAHLGEDGGSGLLAALGAVPRDLGGTVLPYDADALASCDRVEGAAALRGSTLVLATDEDRPLLGLRGVAAASVGDGGSGPRQEVLRRDGALSGWAAVLERDLGGAPRGLGLLPGGGAGGGAGAVLLALGARRTSALALVRDLAGLDDALESADLVVTGGLSFDWRSLRGGVVAAVGAAALEQGVPCLVLAQEISVGRREGAALGVEAAYAVRADGLGDGAAALARQWSRPPPPPRG